MKTISVVNSDTIGTKNLKINSSSDLSRHSTFKQQNHKVK